MYSKKSILSIGLPVFNGERYISQAIDSILIQTFKDFELIISDNASTDRTEQICQEYVKKDSRIKYHKNERNIGGPNNYNLLVKLASGKYFKWAAHDDVLEPTYLEKLLTYLKMIRPLYYVIPK
jgi:glycosyltransferase involved in cell wall biosynthesis